MNSGSLFSHLGCYQNPIHDEILVTKSLQHWISLHLLWYSSFSGASCLPKMGKRENSDIFWREKKQREVGDVHISSFTGSLRLLDSSLSCDI